MLSTDKELYFIFGRSLLKLLLKAIWTSCVNPVGILIYWTAWDRLPKFFNPLKIPLKTAKLHLYFGSILRSPPSYKQVTHACILVFYHCISWLCYQFSFSLQCFLWSNSCVIVESLIALTIWNAWNIKMRHIL